MKLHKYKIPAVLLMLLISLIAHAQSDSLNRSEEMAPNYIRSMQYLETTMNNETQLFKVYVPIFSMGEKKIGYLDVFKHRYKFAMLEAHINYEKKLNPIFSVYVTNVSGFSKAQITDQKMVNEPDYMNQIYNNFDFGGRCYFLIKHRMNRGLSGNNVYGSYLGVAIEGLSKLKYTHKTSYDIFKPDAFMIYLGKQSKLSHWSFFDVSVYAKFNPNVPSNYINTHYLFSMGFSLKIGLAKGIE